MIISLGSVSCCIGVWLLSLVCWFVLLCGHVCVTVWRKYGRRLSWLLRFGGFLASSGIGWGGRVGRGAGGGIIIAPSATTASAIQKPGRWINSDPVDTAVGLSMRYQTLGCFNAVAWCSGS